MVKRDTRFNEILKKVSAVEKSIKGSRILHLGDESVDDFTIVRKPSGSFKFDSIIGGGLPVGRVIEYYGEPSSGKTTLSLVDASQYTRDKRYVYFLDMEHTFDRDYAQKIGIDLDYMFVSQPTTGEEAFELINRLIQEDIFELIIVDSVSAIVPQEEIGKPMTDPSRIGGQAKLMSEGLRRSTSIIGNSQCTVIFINQTRVKIGGYAPMGFIPKDTSGGGALKFYASVRVEVKKKDQLSRGDAKIGHLLRLKVVKNKTSAPFKETTVQINYDEEMNKWGIDSWTEIFDMIVDSNILGERGRYLTLTGEKVQGTGGIPGKEMLKDYLIQHPEEYNYLFNKVINKDYTLDRDENNKVKDFTPPKQTKNEEKTEKDIKKQKEKGAKEPAKK